MNRDQEINDSLLTKQISEQKDNYSVADRKKTLFMAIFIIVVLGLIALTLALSHIVNKDVVPPKSIKLPLLNDSSTKMKLGTSRVLQVLFFSGNDDRTSDDFKVVTLRGVHWRVDPEGIISVDNYGRVEALALGTATIKITSVYDSGVRDSSTIEVVANQKMVSNHKRVIDYAGTPVQMPANYQKVVDRYTKEEVAVNDKIPVTIKAVSADPAASPKKTKIQKDTISWQILNYADGSNRTYVKRTDSQAQLRDKQQYFIGDRYLPGKGLQVISIEDDNSNGIWTVEQNGFVTNIRMVDYNARQKAESMVKDTQKYVMRYGFASDASWNGSKWVSKVSDNDGLWTGMYAAGQLMKYSLYRDHQDQDVDAARASALKSLKAVLMNAYVSGRNGTVAAKIRRYNSSRFQVFLSKQYLTKDRAYEVASYPGSPADGVGYFGQFAGTTFDSIYAGGFQRYDYSPFNSDAWVTTGQAATSKRTLNGYIARSFAIPALQGKVSGGLFFQRNEDGTQTVLSGANNLYDYSEDEHPVLNLGNLELPEILANLVQVDGRPLKGSDLAYKGDTSSDSLIGHLFLYKIAFDVLDPKNNEEKQVRDLVVQTMVSLSQMLINNGYCMVDATGQGTKWVRMTRDFLNSDYTVGDAPLKAIETLLVFKLTAYLTGDQQWEDQYNLLVTDPSFKYVELVSKLWDRWLWMIFNQDLHPLMHRLTEPLQSYSQAELIRHIMYFSHYSDDEEALLAFYLIFQLEDNQELLTQYKKGLDCYWHAISRSQNPLWYLIYQLSEPKNNRLTDHYGNNLIDTAAWSLSRHPIDTTTFTAFVQGSRPDVIFEGSLSANPTKVIGRRKNTQDARYINSTKNHEILKQFDPLNIYEIHPLPPDERSLHKFNAATFTNIDRGNPNNREAATLFTLPYWLGVYHKMIVYQQ